MKTRQILFILLCSSFSWQKTQGQTALKTLSKDTIYFPGIWEGDTVDAVYYIQNQSSKSVKIYQVHPGCRCTAPVHPKDSWPAGKVDSIVLTFYSNHTAEGPFTKYANVLNEGGEITLYLIGTLYKPSPTHNRKPRRYRVTNQ